LIVAMTVALEALELLDNPVTAGFAASFRLGVPQSNSPYVEKQWLPLSEAIINAWNGTQTPQEALAAAQAEIEAEIAKLK
jgi:maltose-binding protein MalE